MQILQIKFVIRKMEKVEMTHCSISKEESVERRLRQMKEGLKWVDSIRVIRVDSKCLTHCHIVVSYRWPQAAPPSTWLCCLAVFVYSMPGYKCSIKDRMLYSTCKGPLLDVATDRVGLEIARKVNNEVSSILVSRRKRQLFALVQPKEEQGLA